jgi:hypothetical protein
MTDYRSGQLAALWSCQVPSTVASVSPQATAVAIDQTTEPVPVRAMMRLTEVDGGVSRVMMAARQAPGSRKWTGVPVSHDMTSVY